MLGRMQQTTQPVPELPTKTHKPIRFEETGRADHRING